MLTSTTAYKLGLHRPHQREFRVDLYSADGTVLRRSVKPVAGSVTANMDEHVTRSAELVLTADLWGGTDPNAVLTPYQTVVKIFAGTDYGGPTEVFQLIEGRVGEVTRNANGTVSCRVDDRAADVVGFQFEVPRNSVPSLPVVTQIRQLITEVLPTAVFGPDDVSLSVLTPKLTWDENRGDALDTLAGALGGRWYQLGNGSFVVRLLPYDVGTPVATIADGEDGLLFDAQISLTRDDTANSVTVVVERADGGAPFRVNARDSSPTSPTRFDGPFGRVSKIIKVQTPLTNGEATAMARRELNAATALSSRWNVSCVADYTLEPGDTVRLTSRGDSSVQIIDRITYPLTTGSMTLDTRAFVRPLATLT